MEEWTIEPHRKHGLQHNTCIKRNEQKRHGGWSDFCARKKDGFHCSWCEKPIPDYILFQWRLLNE